MRILMINSRITAIPGKQVLVILEEERSPLKEATAKP